MFTVYVLFSRGSNKIYIGFTSDLQARVQSHNILATSGCTIRYRPWELLHTENFDNKGDALLREKQLKSARGREWIRKELLHQ